MLRIVQRQEATGLNGGITLLRIRSVQGGEAHTPRLSNPACLCAIDQNLKDPGLEGAPSLEAVDSLQNREPCFLSHFLGNCFAINKGQRHPYQTAVISLDNLHKRRFIPIPQSRDEQIFFSRNRETPDRGGASAASAFGLNRVGGSVHESL